MKRFAPLTTYNLLNNIYLYRRLALAGRGAFTLVELAIVLVIISLIVGAVLVGNDLIHTAQMRSIITDWERYDTAVNTFRNKYNGLPGDLPRAGRYFAGHTAGNQSGNGDGLIASDSWGHTGIGTELCLVASVSGTANRKSISALHTRQPGYQLGSAAAAEQEQLDCHPRRHRPHRPFHLVAQPVCQYTQRLACCVRGSYGTGSLHTGRSTLARYEAG